MKKKLMFLFCLLASFIACSDDDSKPVIEPLAGPSITWKSNPNFDKFDITEKMDVKIDVDAPAGIKTFTIKVESEALKDITEIDLIEPGSDQYAEMILGGAGSLKDKTSYSLDLSELVLMINDSTYKDSDHTFTFTVADKNDSTVMQTVVFHRVAKDFTETVLGVTFEMVYVSGGSFEMGATEEQSLGADEDEYPVHSVTLSDYYIGRCEVTQGLWEAVMGKNPSRYKSGNDYPVEMVGWDETQDFLIKLNSITGKQYALPTEAQWEYAARGGKESKKYRYSGSNEIDNVAWYKGNSDKKHHPVGTLDANELGIYDMSGNVSEWCNDWYAFSYSPGEQINPKGPDEGENRTYRGGNYYKDDCRIATRGYTNGKLYYLGLRVVYVP